MGLWERAKSLFSGGGDSQSFCSSCHKPYSPSLIACPACKTFKFFWDSPGTFRDLDAEKLAALTCRTTWLYLYLRHSSLNIFNDMMETFTTDLGKLTQQRIPLPIFDLHNSEKLGLLEAFHLMGVAKARQKIQREISNSNEANYVSQGLLELYLKDNELKLESGEEYCEGIKSSANPDMFWAHLMTSKLMPDRCPNPETRMGLASFFGVYIENSDTLAELSIDQALKVDETVVEEALTQFEIEVGSKS
jgi:hypothetical protein